MDYSDEKNRQNCISQQNYTPHPLCCMYFIVFALSVGIFFIFALASFESGWTKCVLAGCGPPASEAAKRAASALAAFFLRRSLLAISLACIAWR
mmetsp:Transcript_30172/g.38927  ORF Transcript_30172/g.38927 Transcript_30172/m.38927 type:complete len:94 (-) Transcript_30172:3271-3552(-)